MKKIAIIFLLPMFLLIGCNNPSETLPTAGAFDIGGALSIVQNIHGMVGHLIGNKNPSKPLTRSDLSLNIQLIRQSVYQDLYTFPKYMDNFSKYYLEYQKALFRQIRIKVKNKEDLACIKKMLLDIYAHERSILVHIMGNVSEEKERIRIETIKQATAMLKKEVINMPLKRKKEICQNALKKGYLQDYNPIYEDCEDILE
ncbi:hypothetical protein AB832_07505 [Flavobacteriaceae bacterium (ex Bugula neritina AB1)]|nr:hypothetical protein AB832_07505 [Flavobacteriaceae bacterium (ex Bugula neritina AB1)]